MEEDEELEDFIILETVGKGNGSNIVFKVKHLVQNKTFALKKILYDQTNKSEMARNLNEIKIFKEMIHPNIIQYYDSFTKNDHLFILMEYASGGDLQHIVKKHAESKIFIPEDKIWVWFLEITQAIKYIHLKKILHRDIKTQNIFLDENMKVKLGDFGISKALENTTDFAETSIGTPFFLPPEMWKGEKYNNKADIWMLGCVLFELCTLRKPFMGSNMIELMNNIINEPVKEIPDHYSEDLKSLVRILMNKNDPQRPFIREVLELEQVVKKMNEIGFHEIESPMSEKRSGIGTPFTNIKLLTDDESSESIKLEELNIQSKDSESSMNLKNNIGNPNSNTIEATGLLKCSNSSKPNLIEESKETRSRIPKKVNSKYQSMGNQALSGIIDNLNFVHSEYVPNQTPTVIKNDIAHLIQNNNSQSSLFKERPGVSSIGKYNQNIPNSSHLKHSSKINQNNQNSIFSSGNKLTNSSLGSNSYKTNISSNPETKVNITPIKPIAAKSKLSLEEIYNQHITSSNSICLKIKFLTNKLGTTDTLNLMKMLDKNQYKMTKQELTDMIRNQLRSKFSEVFMTLSQLLSIYSYGFSD